MSKQQSGWLWGILFIVEGIFSHTALAVSPVANTPVMQSDYETTHQGFLLVKTTIFNAPCNLQIKETLMLTGCGAGNNYHEMHISDGTVNTPVTLQFDNPQNGNVIVNYPHSLLNGNNKIQLPEFIKKGSTLRLKVNYE